MNSSFNLFVIVNFYDISHECKCKSSPRTKSVSVEFYYNLFNPKRCLYFIVNPFQE